MIEQLKNIFDSENRILYIVLALILFYILYNLKFNKEGTEATKGDAKSKNKQSAQQNNCNNQQTEEKERKKIKKIKINKKNKNNKYLDFRKFRLTHNNMIGQFEKVPDGYVPCANDGSICNGYNGVNPILYGVEGTGYRQGFILADRDEGDFSCNPADLSSDLNIKDSIPGYRKKCYINNSSKRISKMPIKFLGIQ